MAGKAQEAPLRKVGIDQKDDSAGFRTRAGFLPSFAAGPGVLSKFDISFPYPIDIMQGDYWLPATVSPKSRLWVEIAPNTDLAALAPTAALANAVAAGDTEVGLNALGKAALDAFLTDNGNMQTEEVYFRLTSVPVDETDFTALRKARWDSANGKLVAPDGAAFGLTAAAGDKVFVTIRFEDGTYLAPGEHVRIGDESLGSSGLVAGVKVRFILRNEDAVALEVGFNLTYLHS